MYIHFYFNPTLFCNQNCVYCLNSSKDKTEFNIDDFKNQLEEIYKINQKLNYKIIFEFNGGEFSITKNLFEYFKIFSQFTQKQNIYNLILTTNFTINNEKYLKIINILLESKIKNLNFFVTLHMFTNEKFLLKIKKFLDKVYLIDLPFKFYFRINLIHGFKPLENHWKELLGTKTFQEIKDKIKIVNSQYILKKNIDNGNKSNIGLKKVCNPLIFKIDNDSFLDLCRKKKTNDLLKYINDSKSFFCNQTCPNQDYSIKIFKPKIIKNFKRSKFD